MSTKYKVVVIGGVILGLALFVWLFIDLGNRYFPREETVTMREASIIAKSWIKNFSTSYPLYGKELEMIESGELERGSYEFIFSFITDDPEYGHRKNEMYLQTRDTEVIEAITNETFDEISGEYIEKETTALLYFITEDAEEKSVTSTERVVPETQEMERDVLSYLLEGPSEEEMEEGYVTEISDDLQIYSFRVEQRTAYVELSTRLANLPSLAREQIERTVTQFDTIDNLEEPGREEVVILDIEGIPEDFQFERYLEEGLEGEDVRYLQIILNADPDTKIAERGPGSPGEETEFFGPATTESLMSFQRKYAEEVLEPAGLTLSTGVVDEHTKDKLNAILEVNVWQ